jgi:hypothetical protein
MRACMSARKGKRSPACNDPRMHCLSALLQGRAWDLHERLLMAVQGCPLTACTGGQLLAAATSLAPHGSFESDAEAAHLLLLVAHCSLRHWLGLPAGDNRTRGGVRVEGRRRQARRLRLEMTPMLLPHASMESL